MEIEKSETDPTYEQRKAYYQSCFPTDDFYRWVTRDGKFSDTRELSFTQPDSTYLRFQHFSSSTEFQKRLNMKCPLKFDIGAIYDKLLTGTGGVPKLREFVIDIDMDEYNDVRYCCKGATVCPKCWPLLVSASNLLNFVLVTHFGFKHVLTVFSGRRGLHFWVCDRSAMEMSDLTRNYVVQYLNLFEAKNVNEKGESFVIVKRQHDLFDTAFDILEPIFGKYCTDQEIFCNQNRRDRFLRLIGDAKSRSLLQEKGDNLTWEVVRKVITTPLDLQKIVFTYLYPRLDINVSTKLNHLLKAPFCIHPGTGKVCVPIHFTDVADFDIKQVPTMEEAIKEMSETMDTEEGEYSYKHFLKCFHTFVDDLVQDKNAI
ncbi:DNA primase small subunit, putative [Entamoeba invadens IP1]|uniref:DNA primase n=1 Tax=Entamoeba invadens IP1 TaxID=370355 RepID=A0A0A1UBD1_ENTIV|nr:DNA primase small subunit, putative [Entamoeba invadens IP1]ELP92486.1 DNA primase small subunit, putative [Entamoeba invadens IP1]|eukprot:XP_004259257.1 DNA primase small subunit, putative [Entamoeba invadens IP1]